MRVNISESTLRQSDFIKVLVIITLALIMLVSITDASPYAYIAHKKQNNNLTRIDTATDDLAWSYVAVYGLNGPLGVAVTPDGNKIYVTNAGYKDVSVFKSGASVNTIGVDWGPKGIAISPDGKKAYVALPAGKISIIDTVTDTVTNTVTSSKYYDPYGVAVTPDGTKVYVTCSYLDQYGNLLGKVLAINTTNNNKITEINVGRDPTGVAVTPDGKAVYVANNDGTVSVIDTDKDSITKTIYSVGRTPYGVAVSPDGTKVYVTDCDYNGKVTVIDTATNELTGKVVKVGRYPQGIAFTPDGKKAYTPNNWDANISVIDTASDTAITPVDDIWGFPTGFGQFIVPAPSRFSTTNVVGTNYQYKGWGQYPSINLYGKMYVPLYTNTDPIWKNHVNLVAGLVLDSGNVYNLTYSNNLNLDKGYSLQVKQIDIDGKKVWLELDRNGQYVDDAIISTDSGDHTWTSTLTVLGVSNVPVMKVHVNQIFQGSMEDTVQVDGIWLIDYANAKTLKIGDGFGTFYKGILIKGGILTKIIQGIDESFLGELVFKKVP